MEAAWVHNVHDDVVVRALHELRDTRKRRRLGDWNVIDALYKAYLAAVAGGLGVGLLSGLVGDQPVTGDALQNVRTAGPAVVGLAVSIAAAFGLRSGARGGPLALEAAEVRYVLLAPVDRDIALRQPAIRHVRFTAFTGTVVGSVIGLLAYRRFPIDPAVWIACGAVVGGAAAVTMTATAMIASGRRLPRSVCGAIGLVLIAWSAVDVARATTTSPASLIGGIALWPLHAVLPASVALLVPLALAVIGLRSVGGTSLEAAERRGRLVTHLRFAATLQDVRTVMLLRRQLAAELPRSTPWVRLRPSRRTRADPLATVWRRDWRGILRWPGVRIARLCALGVIAGLSSAAAWSGTTPMFIVAGVAMFVAGLDAIEGLSEEVDRPDRRDSLPVDAGMLHLRHLAAPTAVLSGVALLGVVTAAITGSPALAFQVGLPLVVPAALAAAGAAAVSTLRAPPDPSRLMMDSTGMGLMFHHALPPALASICPAMVLLVHSQLGREPTASPSALALTAALNVVIVAVLILGWVRHREAIAAFFASQQSKAAEK